VFMPIVFNKPTITTYELEKIMETMIAHELAHGKTARKFEEALSKYIGAKHCLVTNHGVAAITLAITAAGVEHGDEIIVPGYMRPAVLTVMKNIGFIPKPVDIREGTYFIDYEKISDAITDKTKAIIIAHTFGVPAPMDEYDFLRERDIVIIEDITHALGAEYKEKKVGTFGDFAFCSFDGHALISTGSGGAVFCANRNQYLQMRDLRDYREKHTPLASYDYAMSDIQAALGAAQLDVYKNKIIAKRNELADFYRTRMKQSKFCRTYDITADRTVIPSYFPLLIEGNSTALIDRMAQFKIKVVRPYPQGIHSFLDLSMQDFPHSERAAKKTVALPLYPRLTTKEAEQVATIAVKVMYE